jgi:hypothetical protein
LCLQIPRFLLAQLHTKSLSDKRTPYKVKSALVGFSKGSAALDEAYKEAVQRIEDQPSEDHQLARKVLSWITCAKRPLTTVEICCALAIEHGDTELKPESVPDVEDLVLVCAGLVVVDQESKIIRLVHYTTQEYFERILEAWMPTAQVDIASTCLTYLSFESFKKNGRYDYYSKSMIRYQLYDNAFLRYAAEYWGEHVRVVQDKVFELAYPFLIHDGLVPNVAQVRISILGYQSEFTCSSWPCNWTGLHITAQLGLYRVSMLLIERLKERSIVAVNTLNDDGQAPLHLAAEYGHCQTAKLLIHEGATIDAHNHINCIALQIASYAGHEHMVKLLLDQSWMIFARLRLTE